MSLTDKQLPKGLPTTLRTLHRVREHARRDSQAALRRAEALRDEQEARVAAVARATDEARAARDPADLASLSAWHAFRLRQELAERREEARLAQRYREEGTARSAHEGRVRDELAIEGAIDAEADRLRAAERYAETRTLDEVGAQMRRVA